MYLRVAFTLKGPSGKSPERKLEALLNASFTKPIPRKLKKLKTREIKSETHKENINYEVWRKSHSKSIQEGLSEKHGKSMLTLVL